MRRGVIIVALLVSVLFLIFINGCGKAAGTVCGDGTCDATESCLCADCSNDPKCAESGTEVKESCDDNNDCTSDSFNALTKQCEHEITLNCCGNKRCEETERCDEETHTTVCRDDCGLNCEGYLEIHKEGKQPSGFDFECGDANCEETGPNSFTIRGTTSIKTTVENIGEFSLNSVTSSFNCKRAGSSVADNDGEAHNGVTFTDNFKGAEKADIAGKYKANEVAYKLKFDVSQIQLWDFSCFITIDSIVNSVSQSVDVSVRQ